MGMHIKLEVSGERRCMSCDAHIRDNHRFYLLKDTKHHVVLCGRCSEALESKMKKQEVVK